MSIDTKIINRLNQLDEAAKTDILKLADMLIKERGLPSVKDVLTIEDIKSKVVPLCDRYPVERLGLFGSYARGEADEESDIDLVVEMNKSVSMLQFLKLEADLELTLGKEIDLTESNSLINEARENMGKEIVVLYEK